MTTIPSLYGPPVSSHSDSQQHDSAAFISIVVITNLASAFFGFLLALAISYTIWRFCFFSTKSTTNKKKKRRRVSSSEDSRSTGFTRVYLFQEPIEKMMVSDLVAATGGFHSGHVVVAGNPSLGTSYKAILQDGSAMTVKKLDECWLSKQRFWAETSKFWQIRHRNLVPLLGFCFVDEKTKLLIYKNTPNGALSSRLQPGVSECLDWATRLGIGIGVARGLAWLHHGFQVQFLHRNLSSRAVLLGEDYEPRITDFGLARLLPQFTEQNTTLLSTKGDVYEFGVILLELATDQTAPESTINSNDFAKEEFNGNLVDWMLWLSAAGRTSDAIGQSLRGKGRDDEIVEFLKIACRCVAAHPEQRPSMYQVYESLKSIEGRREFSIHFDEFPLLYNKD